MLARSRLNSICALSLGLVLAAAIHAQSASAAIADLTRAQSNSVPFASAADATVTVSCLAGKQAVGGGSDIINGPNVAINDVIPEAGFSGITAQGVEDATGTTNNWSVRAYANCAPPIPGLERVVATSPDDSLDKTVTATCPGSKRVLGAGGEISAGGGQVVLEDIRVNNLASVTVQGVEAQGGTASSWFARAYAICADPVAGLQRVAATSASNSSNKSMAANCPAGKHVVGAGAEIGGGGGQVVLNRLAPDFPALSNVSGPPATRVLANAEEDEDGTDASWTVRAIAICAATSFRQTVQTATDSLNKTATAGCGIALGRQVTGGGFDVTSGAGEVLVPRLVPSGSIFSADAFEDEDGLAGSWFLRAYAICAPPLPGQEIVSATSPNDSTDKVVSAACPASKRTIGTGAEVIGQPGQILLDRIVPNTGTNPATALTGVSVAAFEDETGTTGDWQLRAIAVCANPPPGLELVTTLSDTDSDPSSVPATCPAGKNLLGTGAEIRGADGQVVLDDLRPSPQLQSTTVTGLEDGTGTTAPWRLIAYAICANP
jgi:hypothetical protein